MERVEEAGMAPADCGLGGGTVPALPGFSSAAGLHMSPGCDETMTAVYDVGSAAEVSTMSSPFLRDVEVRFDVGRVE
jgi:hypothetical protein